eukprot:TRINITY_DN3941_c0_g1_i1.p1 TRINITY_DN3941_c0_g1~~TRINITY_DN3941_c0_g1_i1.p1  ORF type:complete len:398 (-),score=25.44 TRINITY_DN3941_c0_g1_i1:131-1324(-)
MPWTKCVICLICYIFQTCFPIDSVRSRQVSESLKRVLEDLNKFSKIQMAENWQEPNLAKIVYFMPIYKGEERRGIQLMSRIVVPRNVYFVHMAHNLILQQPVLAGLQYLNKTSKNIFMVDSYMVNYRGISSVDVELTAMSKALNNVQNWDYFITLSALDYPLMTQQNIAKLIGELFPSKNISLLEFQDVDCKAVNDRISRFYRDPATQGQSMAHNPSFFRNPFNVEIDDEIQIFKSNTWKLFSKDLIKYLIVSKDGYARRLLLYFAQTQFPIEHYFATSVCNSPILNSTVRNGVIAFKDYNNIDWKSRFQANLFGPNQMNFQLLKKALSQGAFFASAFSAKSGSNQVKEQIDKLLSGQEIEIEGQKFKKETLYQVTRTRILEQMEKQVCKPSYSNCD